MVDAGREGKTDDSVSLVRFGRNFRCPGFESLRDLLHPTNLLFPSKHFFPFSQSKFAPGDLEVLHHGNNYIFCHCFLMTPFMITFTTLVQDCQQPFKLEVDEQEKCYFKKAAEFKKSKILGLVRSKTFLDIFCPRCRFLGTEAAFAWTRTSFYFLLSFFSVAPKLVFLSFSLSLPLCLPPSLCGLLRLQKIFLPIWTWL